MKRVAIFVEGQGELVFVRNMLFHLMDPSRFGFDRIRLHAKDERDVPYSYDNSGAEVHYKIINVGNDERVLTMIRESEERLFRQGFVKIIGLRDMYSKRYRSLSKGKIDDILTQRHVTGAEVSISEMSHPNLISFHFAIMEIEAWWLSMYHLFSKVNKRLTCKFIERHLKYDLSGIDPQKAFFHPSVEMDKIFRLVGSGYDKTLHEVEGITSKISRSDIHEAIQNGRCECFERFCEALISY